MFECVKCRPRVAVAAACCAIKLHCPVHLRRVNRKVACRDQRVDAYSPTHDVVTNSVDEWVCTFCFREMHVGIVNCFQSCVEEKFVVEEVYAASVKRCDNMPVSVRSRRQFLYSRSSERIRDSALWLNNLDISVVPSRSRVARKISSP